jgi:hypothetical protein
MMFRVLLVAGSALGCSVVTALAYAQLPPLPVVPPLPLPLVPFPEFHVARDAPSSAPSDAPTPVPKTVDVAMRASSDAERLALRRSQFHEVWYGWQTLAVDAGAIGFVLFGAALTPRSPPLTDHEAGPRPVAFTAGALGLYTIGPSTIHFAHGAVLKGLGSIGLRLAMPLAGFAAGYLGTREGADALEGGAIGGVLGCVGAMAADAALLGWDRWYGLGAAPSATALFSIPARF